MVPWNLITFVPDPQIAAPSSVALLYRLNETRSSNLLGLAEQRAYHVVVLLGPIEPLPGSRFPAKRGFQVNRSTLWRFSRLAAQAEYFATALHGQPDHPGPDVVAAVLGDILLGYVTRFIGRLTRFVGGAAGAGRPSLRAPPTWHNPDQPRGDQH
jgi:hypothetical protein